MKKAPSAPALALSLPLERTETAKGVTLMGRGRQKAKATRQARDMKYFSPATDLSALQRELAGKQSSASREDDPYAEYADEYDQHSDDHDDEDDSSRH